MQGRAFVWRTWSNGKAVSTSAASASARRGHSPLLHALLVRVARGRGALDLAVGDALDVLGTGARVLRLGYSGIGDYARERPGIAASTAQKMARLARRLRERPLLRAAVRAGEVLVRAAEAVLPRATPFVSCRHDPRLDAPTSRAR